MGEAQLAADERQRRPHVLTNCYEKHVPARLLGS
jgi:hypothetical protein